jgi:4-alpha-glucanotransferase
VALAAIEKAHAEEVQMHRLGQFLFDWQWGQLRAYARERGVQIIGDAPIFISGDSSDVWAHRAQFLYDEAGVPKAVAGVPPDYFSPTGQLWGNPLYDWEAMQADEFRWWTARMRRLLKQVDLIRLDHFRGFAAAWHVPPHESTALNGKWIDGPREALFEAMQRDLGRRLPIIAEDLGMITPDVHALRHRFGLPGMAVLQFMLDAPNNFYWPHNFEPLTIVYTGTHDNNTSAGWYRDLNDRDRWILGEYLDKPLHAPAWELVRMAWLSVAAVAIAPAQDLLELGSEARMNIPGVAHGNWRWRLPAEGMPHGLADRLHGLTNISNRIVQR